MQQMLQRLLNQGHAVETIGRILAAFPEAILAEPGSDHPGQRGHPSAAISPSAASLTPRELEVLSFLGGPASIKEIALQLHISHATAKRHTINIYAKLGASRRSEAVARAEELKVI
jgi:DNA-binding NarL/FixJ family response regulator